MNAGRDVERLISTWLTEEATDRSRERVLATVHRAIERTPQRRFRVAWREPMYVNPARLAMMAAALVVAVLGGAAIGRMTAPGGSGAPAPTATESQPPPDALAQYRADRDAICNRFFGPGETLKVKLPNIYWDGLSDDLRTEKIAAFDELRTLLGDQAEQLAALDAPPEIAQQHQASVTRFEDINQLIDEARRLLDEGDLAGAEAVDLATNPIGDAIGEFEEEFGLANCA